MDKIRRLFRKVPFLKILAAGIVFALMVADVFTVINMFHMGARFDKDTARLYAVILALILEGLPFYIGIANGALHDKTDYTKGDRAFKRALIQGAFWVTAAVILIIAGIRVGYILTMIREGDLDIEEDYIKLAGQCYLAISPALTSLAAYFISALAFPSNHLDKSEDQYNKYYRKYLAAQRAFFLARYKCVGLRDSVGSSLDIDNPAATLDEFRQECFWKIRNKLMNNCLVQYPTQIEMYSAEVERLLNDLIVEMSKHTTTPNEILKLTAADIIEKYDQETVNDADAWDYNRAGPIMKDELCQLLNMAIVTAQFHTVVQTYNE